MALCINAFAFSLHADFDKEFLLNIKTIFLKKDEKYFAEDSPYIKYCPKDKYTKPLPEAERPEYQKMQN